MKTSVRDYLHTLNVLNKDIDVSVDGTDTCVAVCGGEIKITPYGEEVYKEVLDNASASVKTALDEVEVGAESFELGEIKEVSEIFSLAEGYGKLNEAIAAYKAGTLDIFAAEL